MKTHYSPGLAHCWYESQARSSSEGSAPLSTWQTEGWGRGVAVGLWSDDCVRMRDSDPVFSCCADDQAVVFSAPVGNLSVVVSPDAVSLFVLVSASSELYELEQKHR